MQHHTTTGLRPSNFTSHHRPNSRAGLWLILPSEGATAHRAKFPPQSSLRDVSTMPLVPMVYRGPPRRPRLLMMMWTSWGLSHRLALHIGLCTTTPHRRLLAGALTPPACSQTTARSPSRVGILVQAWAAQPRTSSHPHGMNRVPTHMRHIWLVPQVLTPMQRPPTLHLSSHPATSYHPSPIHPSGIRCRPNSGLSAVAQ